MKDIFLDSNEPATAQKTRFLILFAVSIGLYAKSLSFDFIPTWDDLEYILENYPAHSWSFEHLKTIFTSTFVSNYAPFHMLSYALEHSLWGLNPMGYHFANVILHALNVCLAYVVLKTISNDGKLAFAAALLFAVHPVNVENVAWISESKTLLATLFGFLSLLFYVHFLKKERGLFYALSMILLGVGILCKASVVTIPLVFLAYEAVLLRRPPRWRRLFPFFVISFAGGMLAVWAQVHGESVNPGILTNWDVLFGSVYPTMITVFWKYIGLLFFPINQSGFYETAVSPSWPIMLASLAGWLVLFAFVCWKGTPAVRFWFAWFWLFLLPASNIVPLPVFYADRYLYVSSIGVFVLTLLAARQVIRAMGGARKASTTLLLAAVAVYALIAFARLDVWRNELAFWEDTARKSPNIYKANLNLGVVYEKMSRLDEAELQYRRALAIEPRGEEAIYNLNMIQMKREFANKKTKN